MSIHVENDEQYKAVIQEQKGKTIFVKCSAAWCGPCKVIAPYYEELAEEYQNAVFISLDIDECEKITIKLGIKAMPTFIAFKDEKEVSRVTGAVRKKLKAMVESWN